MARVNYYILSGKTHLRLQIIDQYDFMDNFFLMMTMNFVEHSSLTTKILHNHIHSHNRRLAQWIRIASQTGEERRGSCTVARASRALFSFLEWSGLGPLCKASAEEKKQVGMNGNDTYDERMQD